MPSRAEQLLKISSSTARKAVDLLTILVLVVRFRLGHHQFRRAQRDKIDKGDSALGHQPLHVATSLGSGERRIDLVDAQHIRLRHARPAPAWNLGDRGDVDDVKSPHLQSKHAPE